MEGEETFSLRESRRAAQWKNNGRKEPATTSALHLILREVTAGVAVEEEEEVEGEEEVEMKVEAGVEGEGEAEEAEGEGGKRRKYWKGEKKVGREKRRKEGRKGGRNEEKRRE